jgi:hypothetical protein
MGNGNGGRVTQPNLRVKHRGFPKTELSVLNLISRLVNDMQALDVALWHAAVLGHLERNPAEVERCASDSIELSTRQNFVFWLPQGEALRGWARIASGHTAEGISWIENGIRDYRATGSAVCFSRLWVLKRLKLRLRSAQLSERQGSRSRFR